MSHRLDRMIENWKKLKQEEGVRQPARRPTNWWPWWSPAPAPLNHRSERWRRLAKWK